MSEHYISVDVEASGPIPGDFSLLAIGACSVVSTGQTFYREVKPISEQFDPEALRVSGLSLERLRTKGEEPTSAMMAFHRWVVNVSAGADPVMVGFNGSFDWSFVNWYFVHFSVPNPFGIGAIDIKSYFMGLAGTTWAETRSSRLPENFQPRPAHRHNALDDAVAQAETFGRMLAVLKRRAAGTDC